MKLNYYLIKSFENPVNKDTYSIEVPINAIFKTVKLLPDGIMGWYEIPTTDAIEATKIDTFKIVNNNEEIPKNFELVSILDITISDEESNQQLVIFPVYRLM